MEVVVIVVLDVVLCTHAVTVVLVNVSEVDVDVNAVVVA